MKRIITTLAIAVSAVILLAGCQFTVGSSSTKPIDLTDSASISALCGDEAVEVQAFVASAADAKPTSGKRNALTKWGITDPKDDDAIASILATLDERAQVECDDIDASTASNETDDTKLSQELLDLLDASYAEPGACPAIVAAAGLPVVEGYYDLLLKTLYAVNENGDSQQYRKWSQSISTALPGNTAEEKYESLKVAICTEPLVGFSLKHLFAHLEINGVRVLDLQSTDWLDDANVPADQINDMVAKFFPNKFNLEEEGRTPDSDAAVLEAMTSYQAMADKLLKLLSNYQLVDVRPIDSTHHYQCVLGCLTADGVPEIEVASTLDNRPALVFFLTDKTTCVPISVLAFNVGDKRPELANIPADCSPFLPPPPVTPECTYDCGGTPECTYDCGPPPCVVNCGEKTDHVPVETTPDGVQEPPAPPPTSPPAPPEVVDTTPVEEVDTGTELPPQDTSGTNTGTVSE